ncbi:transposase [Fervidibacillus albus]|uniref:transposase n=1 Tax=Fervidibacillus albus TaxID=2980026 RepID=UPI003B84B37F
MQAKRRFSVWIKWFQFHTCGAVSSIVKTCVSSEKAILNTILSTLSNGMMESTNNKIKIIVRVRIPKQRTSFLAHPPRNGREIYQPRLLVMNQKTEALTASIVNELLSALVPTV